MTSSGGIWMKYFGLRAEHKLLATRMRNKKRTSTPGYQYKLIYFNEAHHK